MTKEFADVPEWPQQSSGETLASGRDARLDNQPPLEERILMEFVEQLDAKGITARIDELLASAKRAPVIDSDTVAGAVGDLIKQAREIDKRVEALREEHNRPLLNAQRSLKSKADQAVWDLDANILGVRTRLNSYMQEKERQRNEAQRKADEETRRLQAEADKAASLPEYAPQVERPVIAKPVARGDLGARVGTVTKWHHEIESVRQLPDRLLRHPKVIDALSSVIGAEIRGGCKEIKGVKIWSTQEAAVR